MTKKEAVGEKKFAMKQGRVVVWGVSIVVGGQKFGRDSAVQLAC